MFDDEYNYRQQHYEPNQEVFQGSKSPEQETNLPIIGETFERENFTEKTLDSSRSIARVRVTFKDIDEPATDSPGLSRDSAEITSIIEELPWNKKHTYRNVTPFAKKVSKTESSAFRPIETSISTEDLSQQILRPVPIFASTSFQDLSKMHVDVHEGFKAKSIDDLLLSNIDGCRKPESKRHKLVRMRSTSNSSLNQTSASLNLTTDQTKKGKAPKPLPRSTDNRHSTTVVYVLDKKRDEFVLEENFSDPQLSNPYENVLVSNNVDCQSTSSTFDSLFISYEDRKSHFAKGS